MLLIALASGYYTPRMQIADALVGSGKGPLVAYSQMTPDIAYPERRAQILRETLNGLAASTERAPIKPWRGGLIVTHCLTEQEAQEVRVRGGVIWHLYGRQTGSVINQPGDMIVSAAAAGVPDHVFTPLEALSELMFLSTLTSLRPRRRISSQPLPGILNQNR